MPLKTPLDILLPAESGPDCGHPEESRIAAFVPIALALIGIAAILLGGISARHDEALDRQAIDQIQTGSITPTAGEVDLR
jgi:hypothetical protein